MNDMTQPNVVRWYACDCGWKHRTELGLLSFDCIQCADCENTLLPVATVQDTDEYRELIHEFDAIQDS